MVLKNLLIIFVSFLYLVMGVNAVVLTPGIDYDLTITDTDKGIWWEEISIYAKTTLNAGDQIYWNRTMFNNSEDIGIEPLFLYHYDLIVPICANDEIGDLKTISKCLNNTGEYGLEEGYLTLPEQINLFQTKSYYLIFGINTRLPKFGDADQTNSSISNYTRLPQEAHTIGYNNLVTNFIIDGSIVEGISFPSGTSVKISYDNQHFLNMHNIHSFGYGVFSTPWSGSDTFVTKTKGSDYLYTRQLGTASSSWYGGSSQIDVNQNLRDDLNGYYMGFYLKYRGLTGEQGYHGMYITGDGLQADFIAASFYNSNQNWQYRQVLSNNDISQMRSTSSGGSGREGEIYLYSKGVEQDLNKTFIYEEYSKYCDSLGEDYFLYGNLTNTTTKYGYAQAGASNNFEFSNYTFGCKDSKLFVTIQLSNMIVSTPKNYLFDFGQNLTREKKYSITINKDLNDPLTNAVFIPYQTNSNYPNFATMVEDDESTTLWFDLNYLESEINVTEIKSYLQDGPNKIYLDQTNDDGGYWVYFEGSTNTAPTLSPSPTLDKSGALELGETVYCNAGTYQDADSDPQTGVEFGWWKNNVQQAPSTQNLNIATIGAIKNDVIKCGQRVSDTFGQSIWFYTAELTVIGAKPTANLSLSPISPAQGENVSCIISNITDSDLDMVTSVLRWIEDGNTTIITSPAINMSGGNLTLDGALIDSDKGYECVATLDDTTAQINISKAFGVGNIAPSMIRTLDLDTSYKYDDYVYSDIGCLAADVNGDTITYTYEYSYDNINWTIAQITTSGKFEWDTSNLVAGDYSLRCKASDGILSTSYSELPSNVSIVKYAKSLQTNTDNFYSIRLTVSSGASVLEDQYDSGSTGYLAGDLGTNAPTKIITYLPDKFDGSRKFTGFEIRPNLVYLGGDSEASGTVKNYDILVYQVDNIGEIPTGTPLVAYYDTNFNIGSRNDFTFDIIPSKDKYVAVKVCRNVNELTNECKSDGNSLTDSIIVRGEGTGTYLAKVDQGVGTYTSVSNLDVKFEWERDPLEKVKTLVELNYPDNMVPFVVLKRGSQEHICGNKDVALKEGILECIESISGSNYFINTETLENNVIYDVVGGAELIFNAAGSKTLSVYKNTAMSASVRMTLLGAEHESSFTSSPLLIFNSNNFWSVGGEFSDKVSSNPLNTVLLDGENSLQFSSSSAGKIIFWMEPIYSNLNVVHGTVMSPVENAQTELDVSFTTDLNVNLVNSYCGLTKSGLLVSRVSIAGTDGGYGCVPYLASTDEAGSYVLVVHVDDGTGYVDEYQSSISYSELKALTINTIDFEEMEYSTLNRTLKASTTISNTGNIKIGMVKIKARLDKFWDNAGLNSFEYKDNLFFADLVTRLDSDKYRKEFLMTEENDMFFDFTELGPGDEIPLHFQIAIPQGVSIDEYTTEWEVLYE